MYFAYKEIFSTKFYAKNLKAKIAETEFILRRLIGRKTIIRNEKH